MSTRRRNVLPGFGLSLGFTIFYLSLIVLIPLAGLFVNTASMSPSKFYETVTSPRVLASYRLTFGASLLAALFNAAFGLVVAWTLTRYTFPGKNILDALVDLPFALPTAVSGIALTSIYAPNGWLGPTLAQFGIKAAFSPLGVFIALAFIGLPFVVRTLQPAIAELEADQEEAARSLGAGRWRTFRWVIAPALLPALLTGFSLAFARALGEYGSVVFISGNMPFETEITSLLIVSKLGQHDVAGATALAIVMLVVSFGILFTINAVQWLLRRSTMA